MTLREHIHTAPATPRFVVCIASHQRPTALNLVLQNLPPSWHAVVVVTDPADAAAIKPRPVSSSGVEKTHVHLFPNSPLGAKWQHAIERARELKPDYLVITGSDDVLIVNEEQLFRTIAGYDMAGLRSFLAFDGSDHFRCAYRDHVDLPIGGGRIYHRTLLEKMRWRLFDTGIEKWLDNHGYYNALRCGAKVLVQDELPGLELVALKGPWPQKNPLHKYVRGRNIEVTPLPHVRNSGHYQF